MKRIFALIAPLFLITCTPCDPVIVENGPLPASALAFNPYTQGETYRFRHSDGLIINYTTERESYYEWSTCTECCAYRYHYQVNRTQMTPDYPVFDFGMYLSNQDTTHFDFHLTVGKYGFYIPTNSYQADYFEKVDSVKIDSVFYRDVFKLKSNYESFYYKNDSIYVDSLYYSYSYGILKIIMSNEETFTTVP
jgi:hypothetical protein